MNTFRSATTLDRQPRIPGYDISLTKSNSHCLFALGSSAAELETDRPPLPHNIAPRMTS